MKKLLLILICLFVSFEVKSEFELKLGEFDQKKYYENVEVKMGEKILCKTESYTGFNWENNKYVREIFVNEEFTFKKVEHRYRTFSPDNSWCRSSLKYKKDIITKTELFLNRCYLTNQDKLSSRIEMCREIYYGEGRELKSIKCHDPGYVFHPEKLFIKSPSSVSKELFIDPEVRGSLDLGVGFCRVLKY